MCLLGPLGVVQRNAPDSKFSGGTDTKGSLDPNRK